MFQHYFSSLLYLIPFYIWSICSKRFFWFSRVCFWATMLAKVFNSNFGLQSPPRLRFSSSVNMDSISYGPKMLRQNYTVHRSIFLPPSQAVECSFRQDPSNYLAPHRPSFWSPPWNHRPTHSYDLYCLSWTVRSRHKKLVQATDAQTYSPLHCEWRSECSDLVQDFWAPNHFSSSLNRLKDELLK